MSSIRCWGYGLEGGFSFYEICILQVGGRLEIYKLIDEQFLISYIIMKNINQGYVFKEKNKSCFRLDILEGFFGKGFW